MGHIEKDYDEVSFGDRHTDFQVRKQEGTDPIWIVMGNCPRCNAELKTSYELTYLAKSVNKSEEDDPRRLHTMACDCDMPHKNRDAKTVPPGCGAYWKIRL